jgi:hypothetical protein
MKFQYIGISVFFPCAMQNDLIALRRASSNSDNMRAALLLTLLVID